MDDAAAEKIARNNVTFRDANDDIDAAASDYGFGDGRWVPFICECSDERCMRIIQLSLDEYRRARSNARWFLHAPGHEEVVPGAVRRLEDTPRFVLVEKIGYAGEIAGALGDERKDE
ncbi:MAG TPA: hypothetical protein VNR59_12660 [Gaiellaceae bacterium]|nr:hypothetical protein [Gaiellaceae bacterium]